MRLVFSIILCRKLHLNNPKGPEERDITFRVTFAWTKLSLCKVEESPQLSALLPLIISTLSFHDIGKTSYDPKTSYDKILDSPQISNDFFNILVIS